MKNFESIRQRYLQDPLPIRLGGIAADLARIASASGNPSNFRAVSSMLRESAYFIEWTAPDTPLETQVKLVDLQILLASWFQQLSEFYQNPSEYEKFIKQSKQWSDEILNLSGLLK